MDDAPLLLPMFEGFYGPHFVPKTVEAIRDQMAAASAVHTILLAEDRGVAVGFASLRLLPQVENARPYAELSDLYVEDGHRRRGIGRALVHVAQGLAEERGCPRMHLVVGSDNVAARALYRSLGFADFAVAMHKTIEGPP